PLAVVAHGTSFRRVSKLPSGVDAVRSRRFRATARRPRTANPQSMRAEHLDGLVKTTIPFSPTQESHTLDQNLPGRRLLKEQGHRLVDELVERHVAFAGRLPGREFGLNRRRRELDDFDLSLELFTKGYRVG